MGFFRSISNFTKRLGLWFIAAGVTLTVVFVGVFIYQWSTYQPEQPQASNCQKIQGLSTADNEAQLGLYRCQRGNDLSWEGHEVWVYKAYDDEWQRLATSPLNKGCLQLALDERQLTIQHSSSRGELSIATTSFVYPHAAGGASTLSIATQRVNQCRPLEATTKVMN